MFADMGPISRKSESTRTTIFNNSSAAASQPAQTGPKPKSISASARQRWSGSGRGRGRGRPRKPRVYSDSDDITEEKPKMNAKELRQALKFMDRQQRDMDLEMEKAKAELRQNSPPTSSPITGNGEYSSISAGNNRKLNEKMDEYEKEATVNAYLAEQKAIEDDKQEALKQFNEKVKELLYRPIMTGPSSFRKLPAPVIPSLDDNHSSPSVPISIEVPEQSTQNCQSRRSRYQLKHPLNS